MSGAAVKAIRERAGMSQVELAAAAGTSQPTISAYESGAKQPSFATLERLARAAGAELQLSIIDRTVLSDAVANVRKSLDDKAHAFRILADTSVRLEKGSTDALRDAIAEDPGSVGDRRWDALVGGIAERLARRHDLPVPAWTRDHHRFSPTFWFVTDYPALHASALVDTPPELSARGVFCHAASLSGM